MEQVRLTKPGADPFEQMRVRPLGLAARRSFSSFLHLARRIQGALRVGQTPLRNVVFVKGSLVGPLSPRLSRCGWCGVSGEVSGHMTSAEGTGDA